MIDYGQQEEKLLDATNIESEVMKLDDNFKIFNSNCDLIEKEIKSFRDIYGKEKIMKIGLKFKLLKENIESISTSIQFVKNFSNNEISKYLKSVKQIVVSISSRTEEINGKFLKLAETSKKRIENQIYINKNEPIEETRFIERDSILEIQSKTNLKQQPLGRLEMSGTVHAKAAVNTSMDLDKTLIEKINLDNMKLKEIKEEYEKVLIYTNKIKILSNYILTRSQDNENNTTNKIGDKLIQFEIEIAKEDKNLIDKTNSGKCFQVICIIASGLIVISAIYFYLKY